MSDSLTLTKNAGKDGAKQRANRNGCKRCGSTEAFYWATSSVTGRNVLVAHTPSTTNAAAGEALPVWTLHECFTRDAGIDQGDQTPPPAPREDTPQDAPKDAPKDAPQGDQGDATPAPQGDTPAGLNAGAAALWEFLGGRQAIEAMAAAAAERAAKDAVAQAVHPTKTVVIREGVKRELPGLNHHATNRVLAALSVGRNVMMIGPAGTGKSTIARKCADGLGVPFWSMSLTSQTGESKFTGFTDAGGNFHDTEAYLWATSPTGLLNLDEIDNGNANALGWANAVISNREVRFPDGTVAKLSDRHYLTATGNTYGFGKTREYVGRNAIDAATKNRFVVPTINIDEALEDALVYGVGGSTATAERVLKYVRSLRRASDATGINLVMSPRNAVDMAALLTTDVYDWDMAVEDAIRVGIDQVTWDKLSAAARTA